MDAKPLLSIFLSESDELVTGLEDGLVSLESNPSDDDAIHRIFRCAHTLKSNAGMFGVDPLVAFAHVAENVLARLRSHEIPVESALITALLESVDAFKYMIGQVELGAAIELSLAHQRTLEALKTYMQEPAQVARPKRESEPEPCARVYRVEMEFRRDLFQTGQDPGNLIRDLRDLGDIVEITADLEDLPPLAVMAPSDCYLSWRVVLRTEKPRDEVEAVFLFVEADNTIRITDITSRATSVLAQPATKRVGELLVEEGCVREKDVRDALGGQRRIGDLLVEAGKIKKEELDRVLAKQEAARRARHSSTIRVDTEKLDRLVNLVGEMVIAISHVTQTVHDPKATQASSVTAVEALEQIGRDLQSQVMAVRMVPIQETFARFQRVVRDLAQDLGKYVVLETEGTETELDKIVVEQLADPLKHMVRNAVAHGIESPEERVRAGKSDTGRMWLRAAQQQGHIIIEVADDGRGIDPDAILAKAKRLGLCSEGAELTESQILDFIFQPGFSTAAEVNEVSGRGVGLDVVRKNVQELRGTIELESAVGRGTTFRMKFPLTLAIIDGMNVGVGTDTLTFPLLSVIELISPRAEQISSVEGKGELVDVRGEFLPMIRLEDVLGSESAGQITDDTVVVVVENEKRKFGVMVDRIIGMDQTVVKPLQRAFSLVGRLDKAYARPEGIAGATILGDGNVGLILDVSGLERMAFGELR